MSKTSFKKFGKFLIVALVIATIITSTLPKPVMAGSNGQVIRFSIKDNTFTYLKVEGTNQYGQWSTWEQKYSYGQFYADTITGNTKWWWKGTVIVTFDITNGNRKTCIIDYLKESTTTDTVPVRYVDGEGCSGDSGSSSNVGSLDKLNNYMTNEDSYKVLKEAKVVYDTTKCVDGIAQGLAGSNPVIVVWKCKGIALTAVNAVLKKYNKELKVE